MQNTLHSKYSSWLHVVFTFFFRWFFLNSSFILTLYINFMILFCPRSYIFISYLLFKKQFIFCNFSNIRIFQKKYWHFVKINFQFYKQEYYIIKAALQKVLQYLQFVKLTWQSGDYAGIRPIHETLTYILNPMMQL